MEQYLGTIGIFAHDSLPRGWEPCNGKKISLRDHLALFSLIGRTLSADYRNEHFTLPDLGPWAMPWDVADGPSLTVAIAARDAVFPHRLDTTFVTRALSWKVEAVLGEIRFYPGPRLPQGWLYCEGRHLEIQRYPDLFAVIGTRFGGDGVRTFALPDLRGRGPAPKQAALDCIICVEGKHPAQFAPDEKACDLFAEIRPFPYEFDPAGWLPCDGRSLPRDERWAPLFAVIDARYGGNADEGTFNLPDLREVSDAAWAGADTRMPQRYYICVEGALPPAVSYRPFTLPPGTRLYSDDRTHFLTVDEGRAVIRRVNGDLVWAAGAGGGTTLEFRAGGDLVLVDDAGRTIWTSGRTVPSDTQASLGFDSDGRLIAAGDGREIWRATPLEPADRIRIEEEILSSKGWLGPGSRIPRRGENLAGFRHGDYAIGIGADGHVEVRRRNGTVVWRGGIGGADRLAFAADGNLELASRAGRLLWRTRVGQADGDPAHALLQVTEDEDVVLTRLTAEGRKVRWSARTHGQTFPPSQRKLYADNSRLKLGETLWAGQTLCSWNGRFLFGLAVDGGLGLWSVDESERLWTAAPGIQGGERLAFETDRGMVLYGSDGSRLWTVPLLELDKRDTAAFIIREDGEIVLECQRAGWAKPFVVWTAGIAAPAGRLAVGRRLERGQTLWSANGAWGLTLRVDGNLVLAARDGMQVWQTGLLTPNIQALHMREDGELVLLEEGGGVAWRSGTAGQSGTSPGNCLTVTDNGTLVVKSVTGGVRWSSGPHTSNQLHPGQGLAPGDMLMSAHGSRLEVLRDGRAVLKNRYGAEVWSIGSPGTRIRGLSLGADGTLALIGEDGRAVWSRAESGAVVRLEQVGLFHGNTLLGMSFI